MYLSTLIMSVSSKSVTNYLFFRMKNSPGTNSGTGSWFTLTNKFECLSILTICSLMTFLQHLRDDHSPFQGGHGTGKTGKTGNLVLTFSRQGKHREFCFDTGKNFETQGKYFSVTQGKI